MITRKILLFWEALKKLQKINSDQKKVLTLLIFFRTLIHEIKNSLEKENYSD